MGLDALDVVGGVVAAAAGGHAHTQVALVGAVTDGVVQGLYRGKREGTWLASGGKLSSARPKQTWTTGARWYMQGTNAVIVIRQK